MVKNNGPLPATYKWWFEVDNETGGISFERVTTETKPSQTSVPMLAKSSKTSAATLKSIPSHLLPGDEQLSDIVEESNVSAVSVLGGDSRPESLTMMDEEPKLGIEEVFDLLPLYGRLDRASPLRQRSPFTGIPMSRPSVAICDVEGGPEYESTWPAAANMEFQFVDPVVQSELTMG